MSDSNKFTLIVAGTEVQVTRKGIKNAYIRVVPPYGEVKVSVPLYMRDGEITAFIGSKTGWIREKQKKYESVIHHKYLSGEEICLWGEKYILDLKKKESPGFTYQNLDGTLYIFTDKMGTFEDRKKIINEIYKVEIAEKIKELIPVLESRTGLHALEWKVRHMTSRWGSCNTKDRKITISSRLAAYPEECLEEVMVHELCHLKVRGHGRDFYELLDRFYPEWKKIKLLLKEQNI